MQCAASADSASSRIGNKAFYLLVCILLLLLSHPTEAYRLNFFGGGHKKHKDRSRAGDSSGSSAYLANIAKHVSDEQKNDRIFPTILQFDKVDKPGRISLLSMVLDHHSEGSWYVPAQHGKFSAGWNRTVNRGFLDKPHACEFRFIGIGLEKTLEGYVRGGTGYLTMQVGKKFYHGYEKNETLRVHCYYMTNKDYGSEFMTNPKTLALAVTCPVLLDNEIGQYAFRQQMVNGYFCSLAARNMASVYVNLLPSSYKVPLDASLSAGGPSGPGEADHNAALKVLQAELLVSAQGRRRERVKGIVREEGRVHAVCTVQTFRNPQSGTMLYLFVQYYQRMGWSVIVYDRFGLHKEFLNELLQLPGFYYHPYTLYQLALPSKYNAAFAKQQGDGYKVYYQIEKNWGYGGSKVQDVADHDGDKSRTYDLARLEYDFMDVLLYADADEYLYCPQATTAEGMEQQQGDLPLAAAQRRRSLREGNSSASSSPGLEAGAGAGTGVKSELTLLELHQRLYQQRVMSEFASMGVEEMRFVRLPYNGRAPPGFNDTVKSRSDTDFTNNTQHCMIAAHARRSMRDMFACWSSASAFDNFPKSADFAGVCPFHYNHWSCEGGKNGGRDQASRSIPRCRYVRCSHSTALAVLRSLFSQLTYSHLLQCNVSSLPFFLFQV